MNVHQVSDRLTEACKLYKVEPDIAMFSKALGNGYAITAVIGKESDGLCKNIY